MFKHAPSHGISSPIVTQIGLTLVDHTKKKGKERPRAFAFGMVEKGEGKSYINTEKQLSVIFTMSEFGISYY